MYGIEDKFISIFFSLLMLLLAVSVRIFAGTFLIPAGIFSLVWFFYSFIPLVFLFSIPLNSLAIMYILAAVLLFSMSAAPFNWRVAFRRNLDKSVIDVQFDSDFLKVVLYFSVAASALLSIVTMLINGFSLNDIFFNLIHSSGEYASVRGSEGLKYGIIGILSIMFTYICPVLGGLRIFAPRKGWFFLVSITPSLLIMVTQSSKLVFLISMCLYMTGAIIAKIYSNQIGFFKFSEIPRLFSFGVILIFLVLISFISRLSEFDLGNLGAIIDPLLYSIISYTMGQVYAFADFFSFTINHPSMNYYANEYYSLGAYTFASIFNMLGIGKNFPAGMYSESVLYEHVFETNIFTFFRGLIYDFGILGSLIFIFIFGLFAHAVTFHVLIKKHAWFALSIFLVLVVFIFMGYLFSVFVARYLFLTALLTWLLLSINMHLNSRRNFLIEYKVNE